MPNIAKFYKAFSLICIVLLFIGIFWIWQEWRLEREMTSIEEVHRSEEINSLLSGEKTFQEETVGAIDLAFKDISITHGEQGILSWKLKATWATMRQESSFIEISLPELTYYMGEESEQIGVAEQQSSDFLDSSDPRELLVLADTGMIFDNTTKINLKGNVVAEYDSHTVTAPSLDYDDSMHILFFNETAHLQSSAMEGTADTFNWNLNTNILSGHGNVDVVWEPEKE